MPTPESEAFLAKKPTVPPTFDGVDYNDTPQLKAAQDAIIKEQWVKSMMARLVRDELGKCYRQEGVNHMEKCGKLRGRFRLDSALGVINVLRFERRGFAIQFADWSYTERYLLALKESKVRGYLFEQQNYIPGQQDPKGQDQVSAGLKQPEGQIATIPAEVAKRRRDDRL
ncbi:MAG: hypothetical protein LQ341_006440 [Variospora aurantia]|nr:MAG: hypothetical protein LQ341_006440 [Variospora aurantia]